VRDGPRVVHSQMVRDEVDNQTHTVGVDPLGSGSA
jgi:hypothetical protein